MNQEETHVGKEAQQAGAELSPLERIRAAAAGARSAVAGLTAEPGADAPRSAEPVRQEVASRADEDLEIAGQIVPMPMIAWNCSGIDRQGRRFGCGSSGLITDINAPKAIQQGAPVRIHCRCGLIVRVKISRVRSAAGLNIKAAKDAKRHFAGQRQRRT